MQIQNTNIITTCIGEKKEITGKAQYCEVQIGSQLSVICVNAQGSGPDNIACHSIVIFISLVIYYPICSCIFLALII